MPFGDLVRHARAVRCECSDASQTPTSRGPWEDAGGWQALRRESSSERRKEASLGLVAGLLAARGAVLELSWAVLGASGAVAGPSWAVVGEEGNSYKSVLTCNCVVDPIVNKLGQTLRSESGIE